VARAAAAKGQDLEQMRPLQIRGKIAVLVALTGMLLFGCTHPKMASELIGVYEAHYDQADERLSLKSDGTFSQEVTLKPNGKVVGGAGTWKYDTVSGDITFTPGFVCALDGFGKLDPQGVRPTGDLVIKPVTSQFGQLRISLYEGIFYRKVAP